MLNMRMVVALANFVMAVTAGLIWFGERGRPLHRNYSSKAAAVGGDLIDIISNMLTVKAFRPECGNGIGYAIRRNRRRGSILELRPRRGVFERMWRAQVDGLASTEMMDAA
jgi:hypothetical protein